MKTIIIDSKMHSFDVYGIKLITERGKEIITAVFLHENDAIKMAEYYKKNGIERDGNIRRVYDANIYNTQVIC